MKLLIILIRSIFRASSYKSRTMFAVSGHSEVYSTTYRVLFTVLRCCVWFCFSAVAGWKCWAKSCQSLLIRILDHTHILYKEYKRIFSKQTK